MTETQPKFPEGARVIGKEQGPGNLRGRPGTITRRLSGSEYQVSFDDGQIEYACAQWQK
jgi:hypothetical protein